MSHNAGTVWKMLVCLAERDPMPLLYQAKHLPMSGLNQNLQRVFQVLSEFFKTILLCPLEKKSFTYIQSWSCSDCRLEGWIYAKPLYIRTVAFCLIYSIWFQTIISTHVAITWGGMKNIAYKILYYLNADFNGDAKHKTNNRCMSYHIISW